MKSGESCAQGLFLFQHQWPIFHPEPSQCADWRRADRCHSVLGSPWTRFHLGPCRVQQCQPYARELRLGPLQPQKLWVSDQLEFRRDGKKWASGGHLWLPLLPSRGLSRSQAGAAGARGGLEAQTALNSCSASCSLQRALESSEDRHWDTSLDICAEGCRENPSIGWTPTVESVWSTLRIVSAAMPQPS